MLVSLITLAASIVWFVGLPILLESRGCPVDVYDR
jgi:hypothetical protein